MIRKALPFLYYLSSFIIVSLGQPARFWMIGIVASVIGFPLFFRAIFPVQSRRVRFWLSSLWYALVSLVQLSWFISTTYQGYPILAVYLFLAVALGLQFGLLSLLLPRNNFPISRMLVVASLWTILEWSRSYFICGFTWNPVGMAYVSHNLSLNFAAFVGIYGLSFWLIFSSCFSFRALFLTKKRREYGWMLLLIAFPYLVGFLHQKSLDHGGSKEVLSVLLIQTALTPEQKEPHFSMETFIPPTEQWKVVLELIKEHQDKSIDLIVLPEIALPFRSFSPYLYLGFFEQVWKEVFHEQARSSPAMNYPYASIGEFGEWNVSNAFWAQMIANHFDAEVVVGLDDYEYETKNSYNAAFHFHPKKQPEKYAKQVLVPLGEYIPFEWCRSLAKKYGITNFFSPGKNNKIFQGKVPFSTSICYEETYGELIRESRKKGAKLLVNLTNDGWFPNTCLPEQHFYHGLVRSVENGVPLIRSTNTGVTGAVDCCGRIIKVLPYQDTSKEIVKGALHVDLPMATAATLYTRLGDGLIVAISFLILIFSYRFGKGLPKKGIWDRFLKILSSKRS